MYENDVKLFAREQATGNPQNPRDQALAFENDPYASSYGRGLQPWRRKKNREEFQNWLERRGN